MLWEDVFCMDGSGVRSSCVGGRFDDRVKVLVGEV